MATLSALARGSCQGKAVVDFKGIPLEQVNKLIEALTGELPPVA
jgi:hypothetical protein